MTDYVKGIDVSAIQGNNVNWPAVAAAGIAFACIKCGDGNNGIDPYYVKNIEGATRAGLKILTYHAVFPLPNDPNHLNRDPVGQATFHYQHAQKGFPVSIDLEWPTPEQWQNYGINRQFIIDWTLSYLTTYEQLSGIKPLIYTYPYYCRVLQPPPQFSQYPLWIASYQASPEVPAPWSNWTMWQDSSGPYHLPVSGVAVDTNKVRDLSLWNTQTVLPASEPVVQPVSMPVISAQQPSSPPPAPQPTSVVEPTPTNSSASIITTLANIFNMIYKFFTKK